MARPKIKKAKYYPGIADRFSDTRKRAGMNLQEAADAMGVKLSYIKSIEYDTGSPNIEFLIKWHKVFKLSYEYILEGV